MPARARRRCTRVGCPYDAGPSGRCPDHEIPRPRPKAKPRASSTALGYDWSWRKLSEQIRAERPTCEASGCRRPSAHVDHVDGDRSNRAPGNLQALCQRHHSAKTARHDGGFGNRRTDRKAPIVPTRARRRCLHPGCGTSVARHGYCPVHSTTRTTLVCGPPLSGKTTYVHTHAHPGDLIVDWDALGVAVSGHPAHRLPPALLGYVAAARDALIDRLTQRRGGTEPGAAWIIHTGADTTERDRLAARLSATVVLLEVDQAECLRRLHTHPDGRPVAETTAAITRWWTTYTP